MKTSMQLRGADQIARKLKRLSRDIRTKELDNAGRAGSAVIRDEARLTAPHRRGFLKRAIVYRKQRALSGGYTSTYAIGPGSKAWYFHFIEFGVAAHVIRAKNKRVLAGSNASEFGPVIPEVFGKEVRHPGFGARGFFRRAFETKKEEAVRQMIRVLRRRVMRT